MTFTLICAYDETDCQVSCRQYREGGSECAPQPTVAPPTPKPHEDRDPAAGAARASEEGR